MAMCRDKAFVDEAEKLGIDMSPIDGATILGLATCARTPRRASATGAHVFSKMRSCFLK